METCYLWQYVQEVFFNVVFQYPNVRKRGLRNWLFINFSFSLEKVGLCEYNMEMTEYERVYSTLKVLIQHWGFCSNMPPEVQFCPACHCMCWLVTPSPQIQSNFLLYSGHTKYLACVFKNTVYTRIQITFNCFLLSIP